MNMGRFLAMAFAAALSGALDAGALERKQAEPPKAVSETPAKSKDMPYRPSPDGFLVGDDGEYWLIPETEAVNLKGRKIPAAEIGKWSNVRIKYVERTAGALTRKEVLSITVLADPPKR